MLLVAHLPFGLSVCVHAVHWRVPSLLGALQVTLTKRFSGIYLK